MMWRTVLCIVLKCFFLEAADEIHLQFCCLPSLSLSFICVLFLDFECSFSLKIKRKENGIIEMVVNWILEQTHHVKLNSF